MPYRSLSGSLVLRRGHAGRSGSILLVVVVALVGLMAAAAVTTDVGLMLMATSRAQNVADVCALAAAGGAISDHLAEVSLRVEQTLEANNVQGLRATYDPAQLVVYAAGQEVPGYGRIAQDEEAVTVRVRIKANYLFGRVLGFGSQIIERRATALRTASLGAGGALMFAGETDPYAIGIDISGSRGMFDGDIHSNTRVDITGSKHHFVGVVEWINRFRVMGGGSVFDVGDARSDVKPYPVSFEVSDFEPFDFVINGNYNVPSSGVVPPGCYRVRGNVHVSGSSSRLENVTFVADGDIQFSGSSHYYTANRLGVFAYSLSTNRNGAIDISGAAPECSGMLYAPDGNVDFSGSDHTFTSIVSRTIDISGTDFHISPSLTHGGGGYRVRLIG